MADIPPDGSEESILDKIPYLLRRHTLKEEMPDLGYEVEVFKRAQSAARRTLVEYKRILVVVCDTQAGRRAFSTALGMAGKFSSELVVLFYASMSQKLKDEIEAAGVKYQVLTEAGTLSGQVLFSAKKDGADLIVIPERFTEAKTQKTATSMATIQIVSDAQIPVMVVR